MDANFGIQPRLIKKDFLLNAQLPNPPSVDASDDDKIVYASIQEDHEALRKTMLNHMDENLKYTFEYSTVFHMVSTMRKWCRVMGQGPTLGAHTSSL